MSSGVPIQRSMGLAASAVATDITAAMPPHRYSALAKYLRMRWGSPSPKAWATGMAQPEHMPSRKPRIIKFSEPVALTPAKACTPTNRPTMMLSARLYTCWNRLPSSIGNQKESINLKGEPWVISRTMRKSS